MKQIKKKFKGLDITTERSSYKRNTCCALVKHVNLNRTKLERRLFLKSKVRGIKIEYSDAVPLSNSGMYSYIHDFEKKELILGTFLPKESKIIELMKKYSENPEVS